MHSKTSFCFSENLCQNFFSCYGLWPFQIFAASAAAYTAEDAAAAVPTVVAVADATETAAAV